MPLDPSELTPSAISARFAWARDRGHPDYVWPAVPLEEWRAGNIAVECATALVLSGASGRLTLPEGCSPQALGVAAFTSGMGPLLGWWLETGTLETDAETAAILSSHLQHARARAARMNADFHRVVAVLRRAAVSATALKGIHTGVVYFPDPSTRPSADIDLLITADAEDRAITAMRAAGYDLVLRETRPRKTEWRPPGISPTLYSLDLSHTDNPWTVEIHTSLDRNFFGIRTLRLTAPTEPAPAVAGKDVAVLTQPELLGFLAVHAAHELHRLPLLRIVELVLVARADVAANRLDWDALLRVLDRADAMRFAFPPFELAERLAPGTLPSYVRHRLFDAATPALRREVERLSPGTAQRLDRWVLGERFMWASGPWESLRCAARLAWPLAHGRPFRQLPDIYLRRLFRVFRGRASLGDRGHRGSTGSTAPPSAGERG